MSAPQHDPELFDELMSIERRRRPVSRFAIATLVAGLLGGFFALVFAAVAVLQIRRRGQRGWALVICGLLAFAGWVGVLAYQAATGTGWWQQAGRERLPAEVAHGLDLPVGQCFWSPAASGETDVWRASCTSPHNAEAFEVVPLEDGPMPDILDVYHRSLARCEADARPIPGVRVQVVTPTTASWNEGKHRAVCYYHFATELTAPA
jgi:hypothetical protein